MQRAWLREFNSLGLQLRPQAAKLVTAFLQECAEPQQVAEAMVEHTKAYFKSRQGSVDPIIDVDVIYRVLDCMERVGGAAEGAGGDAPAADIVRQQVETLELGDGIQVYNVLTEMKPFDYDLAQRQWTPSAKGPVLFPGVDTKVKIYADRYHLLYQRLLLTGDYVTEAEAGQSGLLPGQRVLTPVESLMGNPGTKTTFGLISRTQVEGSRQWVIEDLHKAYPLDFDESRIGEWDYQLITDGSFVIAEGEMAMGQFHVRRLQVPAAVPRLLSRERDQVPQQAFGGSLTDEQIGTLRAREVESSEGFYVVLSEVHLDSIRVLERLTDIFQGYEETVPPAAYVLMGNFSSVPFLPVAESVRAYREGFERVKLIMRHLVNHKHARTRFVFVPGPRDPGAQALPRAPLPGHLTANLAEEQRKEGFDVIFATNPCRIRHMSRELVFFRHDVLKLLRRHEVVPLRDPSHPEILSPQHVRNEMARLLLDQAHLLPLPLQESNIIWAFDHTLRLYPLPHAVFIGGVGKPFDWEYAGCTFCSMGPFHRDGTFYSYTPVKDILEPCDVPDRG